MNMPILEVKDLALDYHSPEGVFPLLKNISFELRRGEALGLVGESGSGKSLTCRALMQLLPPSIQVSCGVANLDGVDTLSLRPKEIRQIRAINFGMIFQNPSTYLDPVMRVGDQISESLRAHMGMSRKEAMNEAIELLRQVGIPDARARAKGYPHEFSGGMRQRVMIAAAIACKPQILIADEPTTALDVTIQAQILRLLTDLRERMGLSIILITHDLSVVSQTCDRVLVLYAGQLMEVANTKELMTQPKHPYTQGLIASQPELSEPDSPLPSIPGQPPAPTDGLKGCRFAPRCKFAEEICHQQVPAMKPVGKGQLAACHVIPEVAL